MQPFGRRRFLCITGLAAAGFSLRSWRSAIPSEDRLQAVSRTGRALGTNVRMTALHTDSLQAQAALDAAFEELELVESLMSIYRPESSLSRLNQEGVLRNPHPYLVTVLEAARKISRRSDGAFDITVQPLWQLFAQAQEQGALPEPDEVALAQRAVDWRRVEVSTGQVRLHGSGTAITLNGIAQGFAADRASAALHRHGVRHALIDTGELRADGKTTDGDEWLTGIQHPRVEDAYVSIARLSGRCLATSGDYATPFSDNLRHHHLFDPHTGYSPTELASVSVVARTALEADALSTAALVLGTDRGAAFIAATPRADALFVRKDGSVAVTSNFPLSS